jgi:predicted transcriptional regulator
MKQHPIIPSSLRDKTKALVNTKLKQKHTIAQIAREAGLSESWVRMFAAGDIKNADAGRVQRLYEYCTGELLKV